MNRYSHRVKSKFFATKELQNYSKTFQTALHSLLYKSQRPTNHNNEF